MKKPQKNSIFSLFFKREKDPPIEKECPIVAVVPSDEEEGSEPVKINPDDFWDLYDACMEFKEFWYSFHSDDGDDPEEARPLIEKLHHLTGRMLGK